MATVAEFIENIIDTLGCEEKDIKITFEKGNLVLIVTGVDEDAFDEDEGFDDGDDEDTK